MPNPPSHPNAATTAFQDPVSGGGSNSPLGPNDLAFLDPPAEPGDLGKLGKYRVIKLLGQGGMGFVFAAQDTHLRRDIALKVMKPELAVDHQFRERFLQEARAAAQVQSEYVVTVYDFGVHGDAPFIAMQLLHGEALQERLQRDGPLQLDVAVAVLRQSAEGLAAAHRLNMTHRDIKPANLWLEADPATGAFRRVKILDFGLARLEDRDTNSPPAG
jgi:urea transport system substrate-binding protein